MGDLPDYQATPTEVGARTCVAKTSLIDCAPAPAAAVAAEPWRGIL